MLHWTCMRCLKPTDTVRIIDGMPRGLCAGCEAERDREQAAVRAKFVR